MKPNYWCAAFTIVVDGVQIDFMELSDHYRLEILKALVAGQTEGTLQVDAVYQKNAS